MPQQSASIEPSDVLVVGTGYLGSLVATLARAEGAKVYTTTRKDKKSPGFRDMGWTPVRFDWTQPTGPENTLPDGFSPSLRVLVSVSYDRTSGVDRQTAQVGGFERLLGLLPAEARICYISTTGVYHQTDGDWVDETSPAMPGREGGKAHLRAEQLLPELRPQSPWHVLRLAGIYGPGRVPRIADVRDGNPIASPETGYLNLIHVKDAAEAVLASWESMSDHSTPADPIERLFLLADDSPVVRGDFYREIARQCDAPEPRFVAPKPDSPKLMRSESNKRVRNNKMKQQLRPELSYPDYRSGLAQILDATIE
ncbi:MAG: NAD-dependent epimerase/dehydratase family protein [Planctomycetota bacterium]